MIHVRTKAEVTADAPRRWASQYKLHWRPDKAEKTALLDALAPGFTAEQVNQIIGNNSWTACECDNCGNDQLAVAVFDVGGGEYTYALCKQCLTNAASVLP